MLKSYKSFENVVKDFTTEENKIKKKSVDIKNTVEINMRNKNYLQYPIPPTFNKQLENIHNSFRKPGLQNFIGNKVEQSIENVHANLEQEISKYRQTNKEYIKRIKREVNGFK